MINKLTIAVILLMSLACFDCEAQSLHTQIIRMPADGVMNPTPTPTPIPTPTPVAMPNPNNARFYGKYMFIGRGNNLNGTHPFYEHGWLMADGAGHWTLHTMSSNENDAFHSINAVGNYSLNATGAGTENQQNIDAGCTLVPAEQIIPGQCGDHAAVIISSDGSHGVFVSMEPSGTWEVELIRDPEPVPPIGFLATCVFKAGAVTGCDDHWTFPAGWL